MAENQTKELLRIMAWERAKGELYSMLRTYQADRAEFNCLVEVDSAKYDKFLMAFKTFRNNVEDNGLQK